MVTQYIIPCSACGKEQKRKIYCCGACRVRGHRDKDIKELVVNSSSQETRKAVATNKPKAVELQNNPQPKETRLCKHGSPPELCFDSKCRRT
mgnify:FL=1